MKKLKILVRGGGDLATGTIHRLWRAGYQVLVLECRQPAAIRRQVALCEAVYSGRTRVEDVEAVLVENLAEAELAWAQRLVPVMVDEEARVLPQYAPDIVVDAIMAKKNLGTTKNMAPMVIALGPGFVAGEDVDCVIETKRGHNLGRIIFQGAAAPNSGVPGLIGGYGKERVIHAPAAGRVQVLENIGAFVEKGQPIAELIDEQGGVIQVRASLTGIIRGMIRPDFFVTKGFKMADIDPRQEELANCFTISDKARCIAGSVLELAAAYANRER